MLEENQTYMVYNGDHIDNVLPLKVCVNSLKLLFNVGMTIAKV